MVPQQRGQRKPGSADFHDACRAAGITGNEIQEFERCCRREGRIPFPAGREGFAAIQAAVEKWQLTGGVTTLS